LDIGDDASMTEPPTSASPASDPNAIRVVSLPKSLRGFDETATRKLLSEVATVVESLTAERENLRQQVESLQSTAASNEPSPAAPAADERPEHESAEALGNAILAAKHAGEELIAAAQEEANQILADAAAEADRLAEQARNSTADIERELAQERERLERERADHERAVNEWSAKVETEKEATMAQARAEAAAVLERSEEKLGELIREKDTIERLISEMQTKFISMLQAALAELEPLIAVEEAGESSDGDLPGALQTRVGSTTATPGGTRPSTRRPRT
jgi:cell division septum initiation protein DivIVA